MIVGFGKKERTEMDMQFVVIKKRPQKHIEFLIYYLKVKFPKEN